MSETAPLQPPEQFGRNPPKESRPALATGSRRPRGRPLSNAELRTLTERDLEPRVEPPGPRGRPLPNAELRALTERDLLPEGARPMSETAAHDLATTYTRNVLRARYDGADVSVERNMRLAFLGRDPAGERPWTEGEQRLAEKFAPHVEPDVMVAFGVPPRRDRTSYLTWKEGPEGREKAPDFVLEVASKGNWRNDYAFKLGVYERIGVAEYFVFDPRPRPRGPRLTAYRLNPAGSYEPLRPTAHGGVGEGIASEVLGLVAYLDEAEQLCWWDPAAREKLRDIEDAERDRKREREARKLEREAHKLEREAHKREREAHKLEREARRKAERELAALREQLAAPQAAPGAPSSEG